MNKQDQDLQDKSIEEIAIMINEKVGEAEADNTEQCRMIPIGVKPAGGPWAYLVYSEKNTDSEELQKLADRYNELDRIRNEESGAMSTGDFATQPALEIIDGKCRGDGMYAWNPGDILEFNDIEQN